MGFPSPHPGLSCSVAIGSASSFGSNTEVFVMEDSVFVLDGVFSWDSVGLLLDVNYDSWVLNDERNFLRDDVLFNFPNS